MMWLVMGAGLVAKPGAGTLSGGRSGRHGYSTEGYTAPMEFSSLATYLLPG